MRRTLLANLEPFSGHFGGKYRLHIQSYARNQHEAGFYLHIHPKRQLILKRTTRRYISEDRVLHNHRCENLKS
jgi:hypothetical protein